MTGTDAVSMIELLSMKSRLFKEKWSLFICSTSYNLSIRPFWLNTPDTNTSISLESIAKPVAIDPYICTLTYGDATIIINLQIYLRMSV